LFLDGCGRTDLPGGDAEAIYESITQRLATVPDDTVLYPVISTRPSEARRSATCACTTGSSRWAAPLSKHESHGAVRAWTARSVTNRSAT
jgi:hypothetical protein